MDNEDHNREESKREVPENNISEYLTKMYDSEQFKLGIKHSSYVAGFASGFLMFDLSKTQIENIIISKMNLEAQLESLRMSLESGEKTAQIYAENNILMTKE